MFYPRHYYTVYYVFGSTVLQKEVTYVYSEHDGAFSWSVQKNDGSFWVFAVLPHITQFKETLNADIAKITKELENIQTLI